MNVVMNLISLCNSLPASSTYRAVAESILDNLSLLPDASIYDVMEFTAASRSTIMRMIKLMGYDTYTEFRYRLRAAVNQYFHYNWSLPITPQTDRGEIVGIAADQLRESAEIVEHVFTWELLNQVAGLLHEATQVRFYDFPSTSSYFLIQNLAMDRKQVRQYSLYPDMERDAKQMTGQSVLIAYPIDETDMMDMSPIYEEAKRRKATIILGCDQNSRYHKYGTLFLLENMSGIKHPMARRHVMEMFYLMVSEFYRKTYL